MATRTIPAYSGLSRSAHFVGAATFSALARSLLVAKAMQPRYSPDQQLSGSRKRAGTFSAATRERYGAVSPLFLALMCSVPTPPTQMEACGFSFSASMRATASPLARRTHSTLMPVSASKASKISFAKTSSSVV